MTLCGVSRTIPSVNPVRLLLAFHWLTTTPRRAVCSRIPVPRADGGKTLVTKHFQYSIPVDVNFAICLVIQLMYIRYSLTAGRTELCLAFRRYWPFTVYDFSCVIIVFRHTVSKPIHGFYSTDVIPSILYKIHVLTIISVKDIFCFNPISQ